MRVDVLLMLKLVEGLLSGDAGGMGVGSAELNKGRTQELRTWPFLPFVLTGTIAGCCFTPPGSRCEGAG